MDHCETCGVAITDVVHEFRLLREIRLDGSDLLMDGEAGVMVPLRPYAEPCGHPVEAPLERLP